MSGPLTVAKSPVGPGATAVVGLTLSILVVGVGVIGVHDALLRSGLAAGTEWIEKILAPLDGLAPAAWMVPAGLVLLVVGLWALQTALRPRPRTAIALAARTGVLLRPRDVAKLARSAAEDVDGVLSAKVTASRRTIGVTVRATSAAGLDRRVTDAVTTRLSALAIQPRVRVRITPEAGSS